jgi:hypothetical protein
MPLTTHWTLHLCTRHCHLVIAMFVVTDNGLDVQTNSAASWLASSFLWESRHLYNVVIVRRLCPCRVATVIQGESKIPLTIGGVIMMQ